MEKMESGMENLKPEPDIKIFVCFEGVTDKNCSGKY